MSGFKAGDQVTWVRTITGDGEPREIRATVLHPEEDGQVSLHVEHRGQVIHNLMVSPSRLKRRHS